MRYKAAGNDFTSDWALFKHESQQWRARGHVLVKHETASGDLITGRGEESAYNQKTQRGSVEGQKGGLIAFERAPAAGGEPDRGEAVRLDWVGRESASLTGEAHVWGPRLEGWADRIDFTGASGFVTLNGGRPVLVKGEGLGVDWVGALKADSVTAERQARRITAEGRVTGWLEFRDVPAVPK